MLVILTNEYSGLARITSAVWVGVPSLARFRFTLSASSKGSPLAAHTYIHEQDLSTETNILLASNKTRLRKKKKIKKLYGYMPHSIVCPLQPVNTYRISSPYILPPRS